MQNTENLTCEELCQLMLDMGKEQAARMGFQWDNRHPTYREIYAAYRANDLTEAKRIYVVNFC